MYKFLWPLLVVNLSIPGLIWPGTAYFVQNNTTIILPRDTRRTMSELPCRAPVTHFWRQNRSLETKMVHIFNFFPTSLVFDIVNPFSWIFITISSDKFAWFQLDVRTLEFFPPAESWLVDSNFPRASRMQGLCQKCKKNGGSPTSFRREQAWSITLNLKNRASLANKATLSVSPKIIQFNLWSEMFSAKYCSSRPTKWN